MVDRLEMPAEMIFDVKPMYRPLLQPGKCKVRHAVMWLTLLSADISVLLDVAVNWRLAALN